MQESVIYVVITTHLPINRRLLSLFTASLQQHPGLEISAGPVPGTPTFVDDPYDRRNMRFVFSEHIAAIDLTLIDESAASESMRNRIMPAVPDAPVGKQVLISVIGRVHCGKTAVIRELARALRHDDINAGNITRYTLDHPESDPALTPEENAACIAKMSARRIVFLFQKPRRETDLSDLLMQCGATKQPSKET